MYSNRATPGLSFQCQSRLILRALGSCAILLFSATLAGCGSAASSALRAGPYAQFERSLPLYHPKPFPSGIVFESSGKNFDEDAEWYVLDRDLTIVVQTVVAKEGDPKQVAEVGVVDSTELRSKKRAVWLPVSSVERSGSYLRIRGLPRNAVHVGMKADEAVRSLREAGFAEKQRMGSAPGTWMEGPVSDHRFSVALDFNGRKNDVWVSRIQVRDLGAATSESPVPFQVFNPNDGTIAERLGLYHSEGKLYFTLPAEAVQPKK